MDPQLRRVLIAENPWLRGEDLLEWMQRFLPTNYIPRRLRLSADHRVVLVVGPRQGGKSTLIWKTLAQAAEPVLFLNCEEPSIREWLSSPAAFLADLTELAVPARSFLDAYQPEQLLVVNRRGYPEMAAGATRVRFLQVEELSAAVESFLAADRVPPTMSS